MNGKCSHPLEFAEVLRLSTECYFVSLSYSFVAPKDMIDMLRPLPACLLLSGKRATAFIAEVVSAVSDISQLYSVFGDEALSFFRL